MSYIVQRQDRFYVVFYDGLDPLTGRERRRWHPVGHDRGEAERLAARLDRERHATPAATTRPVTFGEYLANTWIPHKRQRCRAVMDRCRAQRVPHRRAWAAALRGAAPRRAHRDASRRDRRARVVRPKRRPRSVVGLTHAAERRRPARRVCTQDPPPVAEAVEIDRATLDELRRWRRLLERDGLPCGSDDWMFCNTTGRFLNPESISQLIDRIRAAQRPATGPVP